MTRKLVWIATMALTGCVALAGCFAFVGPAAAQYRGYGYGYDAGPNYFENSPAYDPFSNEGGNQGYSQRDYPPPPQRDYYAPRGGEAANPDDRGVPPVYHAYGNDQPGQPYYPDQGQAYGPDGGGRYDLGENADNRTMVEVPNPTRQPAGTIVIDTGSRHLYLVEQNGQALQYGIGVGREGFAWKGTAHVQRKAEWPGWTPPAEMLKRRPDLPLHMEGGIDNPLGARALYLFNGKGDTGFRIHGTNEPDTIGKAVSSGCIRMMNADVIDLYGRVPVGTRVVVL